MLHFEYDEVNVANCVGRFKYTIEAFKTNANAIQQVYSQVIPWDVTYDPATEIFTVIGMSAHFDELEQGETIPEYKVIFTETPFGTTMKFEIQEDAS